MKFQVTYKDPDSLQDQMADAVKADVEKLGLPKEEEEAVFEVRYDAAEKVCREWFKWGEYLTVEIDTEAKTAIVVPAKG